MPDNLIKINLGFENVCGVDIPAKYIHNSANPLSPANPANQEHDSKRHKTKNKKEQSKDKDELSEPVQFVLGCLTIGGLLFAFYYIIFKVAESDKL